MKKTIIGLCIAIVVLLLLLIIVGTKFKYYESKHTAHVSIMNEYRTKILAQTDTISSLKESLNDATEKHEIIYTNISFLVTDFDKEHNAELNILQNVTRNDTVVGKITLDMTLMCFHSDLKIGDMLYTVLN